MRFVDGSAVFGDHDGQTIEQITRSAADRRVVASALMADGHLGYAMPIGGVVAYDNAVSPNGVGFDISCGNKAVLTDASADDVRRDIASIMDDIFAAVSFGLGSVSGEATDHELFDDPAWRTVPEIEAFKDTARKQLGSIGSGNHYVDLFSDEHGRVWIGVHFGSRGLGHKTCTGFMNLAKGLRWSDRARGESMHEQPTVIDFGTPLGDDYWDVMHLAGRFAYAGRDLVCRRVAGILGAAIVDEVHNHHNFAWRETHGGVETIVVRKGATPAFPGQRGFVGGSMGDNAVIVRGAPTTPDNADEHSASLRSTVHGAGRVMSRRRAAGKVRWKRDPKTGKRRREIVAPGEVSRKMMTEWLRARGIELRGGGTDESPHVYRRLPEVLREHRRTAVIEHTLTPLGVAMAPAETYDPYKD